MNTLRREKILDYIANNQVVSIRQLGALMPDVSTMTLHRDLNYLQDQGVVQKVRGGARYTGSPSGKEPPYTERAKVNKEAKARIARDALPLLNDVESVFLDAGTTTLAVAGMMPELKMNVITTGPHVALELARRDYLGITVCGGTLDKASFTLSGAAALALLSSINIDLALLSVPGYSLEAGFTCGSEREAEIKHFVAGRARHSVALMDSSKIGRILPYTFATPQDLDGLVTEVPPQELEPPLRRLAENVAALL